MSCQKQNRQGIGSLRQGRLQVQSIHIGHAQICQHTARRIGIAMREKLMC